VSLVTKTYDSIAQYWDDIYKNEQFYPRGFRFVEDLRNQFNLSPVIHDVACGTGILMEIFHKSGYQVSGSDISSKSIQVCKMKMPNSQFTVSSYDKFSLPEKAPILICFFNSISYTRSAKKITDVFIHWRSQLSDPGFVVLDIFIDEKERFLYYFKKMMNDILKFFGGIRINKMLYYILIYAMISKFKFKFEFGIHSSLTSEELKSCIKNAGFNIVYEGLGYMGNGEMTYVLKKAE